MPNKKNQFVDHTNSTMLHKKLSFSATEAYKLLRTNLLFALHDDAKCQIVGVTSSMRGEGKSTTAINLSYTLAEMGKRVLLIDADLRLPSVAKKLELQATPGLSNLIVGNVKPQAAVRQSEVLENWHILPAGDIPPNPTEMLGSTQMERLLKGFSETYEYIIIDLPPVNIVSDALVISPQTDGMIVVVREDYSERRALNMCTRQLTLSNVKILGFVMNVSREDSTSYGRYKRYKYYKYSSRYYKYSSKYYKHSGYYKSDSHTATKNNTKKGN